MEEKESRAGLWHHFVAGARDVLVVSAVISLLAGAMWGTLRPYWEPFSTLPQDMAQLRIELQSVTNRLNSNIEPLVVDFAGNGIIKGDRTYAPGDSINVLYLLRRSISCQTRVEPYFYNIDTNREYTGEPFNARRAPVTSGFILFTVNVDIPEGLPNGDYVYSPVLIPMDCGVYRELRVPPSGIIEVRSNGDEE